MAARPTRATSSVSSVFGRASFPCGAPTSAPEGVAADVSEEVSVHAFERAAEGADACKVEGAGVDASEGAAAHAPEGTLAGAIPVAPAARQRLATFRSLYSSRDGALCVYEDEDGHLIAVDASKFA